MATPFARLQKSQEPISQVIKHDKEVLKKEHQVIYDVFFERMEAYRDWDELEEHYPGQKGIFAFMLNEQDSILKNINPKDVNSLSEENFRQLLLSIFKKIRKQHLANYEINQILAKKGNVTDDEVNQILAKKENVTGDKIAKCIEDAQGTEAKDILIKFAGGLFGIDVDPKDISGSIKRGLLEKIPFLGKGKEEDNQPSLSGTQVVTTFLRKSLLPIILFSFSLLIFGSGPIVLTISGIGLLITEVKVVKSLFSNDKEGTVYNTHKKGENILFFSSHDVGIVEKAIEHEAKLKQAEDNQKTDELRNEISEGINKILQKQQKNQATPVIEQVTGPQKKHNQQTQVDSKEESMSQTDQFSWAQREKNKNKKIKSALVMSYNKS